jgi:hypothetical protein
MHPILNNIAGVFSTKRSLYRMLESECRYNLSLLGLVKDGLEEQDPSHLLIFSRLVTEHLEVFIKEDRLYNSLEGLLTGITLDFVDAENQMDVHKIILVYNSIRILKLLPELNGKEGMRQFRFAERSSNLKKNLVEIIKVLNSNK